MSRFPVPIVHLVIVGLLLGAAPAVAADSQSSGPARHLVEVLTARHLDAGAATDPDTPGRFIAAMFIAPSQLLVVAGSHPEAAAVAQRLRAGQYRDVYVDLQTTPQVKGKLFVHDIGADGLNRTGKTVVDNAYRDGRQIELAKTGKSDPFAATDAEYARMLKVLATALEAAGHDGEGASPAPAAATP